MIGIINGIKNKFEFLFKNYYYFDFNETETK